MLNRISKCKNIIEGNLGRLSSFFIVLLIMVFLFTPFARFRRVVFIYPLFALWLLSTIKSHWLFRARGVIICIICISLLHILLSLQTDYSLTHFISFNLPTSLWVLCFVYYSQNTNEFRSIVPYILIIFLISSVLTIRANLILPGASRYLATGANSAWADLRNNANALLCGGYEFIFAIPFLLFPFLVQLKNRCYKYTLLFSFHYLWQNLISS